MFNNSSSCLSPTHALHQTDILPHLSSFISLNHCIIPKSTCLHKSWCCWPSKFAHTLQRWVKRASWPRLWVRATANSHPQLPTSLMVIYHQIPRDKPGGPAFEDGTDTGFWNVGQLQFDAGEIPRRKYTIFKSQRKSEIKNLNVLRRWRVKLKYRLYCTTIFLLLSHTAIIIIMITVFKL